MAKVGLTDTEKEEAIDFILSEIREGKSARSIFKENEDSLPSRSVFNDWLNKDANLADQYARACEDRAELIFEDILNISDAGYNDAWEKEDGTLVINHDIIQRDRLRIDARKWMLGKMQPKKYGDKVDVTSDGEKVQSVTIFQLPDNGRQ